MQIIITWTSSRPDTIWNKLAEKLGREPTAEEAKAEVRRILQEAREAELDRKGVTR